MTRETKIGLLVGLAFIIVIGILLSDHLTSSTEPPPATLANAGSNVMQTINTPGGANVPPVTSVPPPQNVTPNQTVPTNADLTPRPQPVQVVQIGPGSSTQRQALPITVQQSDPPLHSSDQPRATNEPPVITMPQPAVPEPSPAQLAQADDSPLITQLPAGVERSLAQAAQHAGEQLVMVDGSGRPPADSAPGGAVQPAVTGLREHKAEPGDSVSRMASRFLGADTKTNRELIIRANPSLQKDPNLVVLGHTYMIPVVSNSAPPQPQAQPQPSLASERVASPTEYWYTVKENDTLWKIAQEQLGDAGARTAIKELNRLPDENKIYVGMKLKLPGKPVAQAN